MPRKDYSALIFEQRIRDVPADDLWLEYFEAFASVQDATFEEQFGDA